MHIEVNKLHSLALELDHNKNYNVYQAIKTIGKPQPSVTSELVIRRKDGTPITTLKEKVKVLSSRYQTPLGYHPRVNKQRRILLKTRREFNERVNPLNNTFEPVTINEVKIAKLDLSNKIG